MRVKLSKNDREKFFGELNKKGIDDDKIKSITGVSVRTVFDWRRGKYTIPRQHFQTLIGVARISPASIKPILLEDWSHNKEAGRKGASVRMLKYGPLGTPEGRSVGGSRSYALRKNIEGDIFTRNKILFPNKNELLAELVGIMIGDGNMSSYQASVSVSSLVDQEYSLYIAGLIEKLFAFRPTIKKKGVSNCLVIVASSVTMVEFLKEVGVLKGHKIRQNLDIPRWILEDREFAIACLRGIFDTDGCVFQENHRIKEKIYSYPRWVLVSASPNLRATVHQILLDLEFNPKIRNNRSVNLESFADISAYFRIVGTSNPKHSRRWAVSGEVA